MTSLRTAALAILATILIGLALPARAQDLPAGITPEQLANDNNLFLKLARKAFKWEEPAEPVHIVGPLYFVGTKGLGVFLFATPEGHILMNTGMPSSGPMIVESIKALGFKPEDIKIMINGHAHIDHAGAFAYLKQQIPGAQLAVMREDVPAMESGDKGDFKYGDDFVYPPVKVDRVLRDGDTVRLGDVALTAYLTPGHTRGATTWVTSIVDGGKTYTIVFPDGAGFNPGCRLAKDPSYPGIAGDYRRTHHFLEMLKPDIWLAQHNEYYDLDGKRRRVETEGVGAWIDPRRLSALRLRQEARLRGRGRQGTRRPGERWEMKLRIGTPEDERPALGLDPRVAVNPASYTGHYLKQVLKQRGGAKARREPQAAE